MIYEYRCRGCGQEISSKARMGQAPRVIGCKCGASAFRIYGRFQYKEFKPYVTDELQEIAPWVRVESRKQEREICQRLGKTRVK